MQFTFFPLLLLLRRLRVALSRTPHRTVAGGVSVSQSVSLLIIIRRGQAAVEELSGNSCLLMIPLLPLPLPLATTKPTDSADTATESSR